MASLWQSVKQWLGVNPAPEDSIAQALYTQAVNQARQPEWYVQGGVPDTLDGRFEMILLHLFALQERLSAHAHPPLALAVQRGLSEAFFRDMDRSLRELGVADTGVGRRIKNMAEAYFGRLQAYKLARTAQDDATWQQTLARNVYGKAPVGDVAWLSAELERWFATLHAMTDDAVLGMPETIITSRNAA